MGNKNERTLVILKPDSVQRSLIGEIISRIEKTGLKLMAIKHIQATEDQLWKHYNKDDVWFQEKGAKTIANRQTLGMPIEKEAIEYGKEIIRANIKFMMACPVIPMVWQGNEAVKVVKKIVGTTEPATSDVGTIRGDYTIDSYELSNVDGRAVRNLIHCSDQVVEAERELAIWFNEAELPNYTLINEQILYHDISDLK